MEYLQASEPRVRDKLALKETLAGLHQQLAQKDVSHRAAAHRLFLQLMRQNPENGAYCSGLEETFDPPLETEQARLEFYESLQRQYPRASMPKHMPLFFATGPTFETLLTGFLHTSITKGKGLPLDLLSTHYLDH